MYAGNGTFNPEQYAVTELHSLIASASTVPNVLTPWLGAHMPTAGGVQFALASGQAIGCEAVQLFTASPRQWRASPLKPGTAETFMETRAACGTRYCIAHDFYLINLAAPTGDILNKSLAAFREELQRAEALGLDYLVTHMGAHGGDGEEIGLERLSKSLDKIHQDLPGYHVRVALETTAGQGTYFRREVRALPAHLRASARERTLSCLPRHLPRFRFRI